MFDDRRLLEGRLSRFARDHLEPAVYRARAPLTLTSWAVPGEPVPFAEAVRQEFTPLAVGSAWGTPWSTLWIHITGAVPAEWGAAEGAEPEVVVDLGFTAAPGFQAEGLAYPPRGSSPASRSAHTASCTSASQATA
jgi:alpha-mannosidase